MLLFQIPFQTLDNVVDNFGGVVFFFFDVHRLLSLHPNEGEGVFFVVFLDQDVLGHITEAETLLGDEPDARALDDGHDVAAFVDVLQGASRPGLFSGFAAV